MTSDGRPVDVPATDGLLNKGLFYDCGGSATVIHIHGKCGNFYENQFIESLAAEYRSRGINLLAANNRGHDCIAEAYRNGDLCYVGGSIESIEECIPDIQGAVEFAEALNQSVLLQGHSHGCEKALWYLRHGDSKLEGIILLSPANSLLLQQEWLLPRSIEEQIEELSVSVAPETSQLLLLPAREFGVRTKKRSYSIPISRGSLVEWLSGDCIHTFDPGHDVARFPASRVPSLAYVGRDDDLQLSGWETMARTLTEQLPDCELVSPYGDHHMRGCEGAVSAQIAKWAASVIG